MVDWPTIFPSALLRGYSHESYDNIVRTSMEAGAPKQRRRFLTKPMALSVVWIMDQRTYETFQGWFTLRADDGAMWINMKLTLPNGATTTQVRFKEQPQAQLITDDDWEVSATLETRTNVIISEQNLADRLSGDLGEVTLIADRFHILINEKLPNQYDWSVS